MIIIIIIIIMNLFVSGYFAYKLIRDTKPNDNT